MLHSKAGVERPYILNKDGGRGLINVETTFKTATIGLDHYLKHKEGQYPKPVLQHQRSQTENQYPRMLPKFKKESNNARD